ncbi:sporulation protein YunB [Alkalithermobacter thermoalcaliphilus JW-YL-7 = DSM 7308]|uniref:Sporulation protein YunB n=1 Tax=Alkalithermobacter thermoalcaliphilus JW-YL-7 = DSM 7308 TaxID=1121328 RepID=A0A150FQB4_CLOPD|nr:sporulation protein YunB [[Clostridium] paradoxum JW-YL-7 = DSM 7308]SHK53352.1 sporulation protein YunB [[Clostridium] paradoxum JW-YL-7 = DSM 7308]
MKRLKFKKKRNNKKVVLASITISFVILFIYLFFYVDNKIKPTVQAIAEARAQEMATRSINDAVKETLREKINYDELISLKTDNEGNITMVQANTILMNKIASDVANEIQQKLRQIKTASAYIPLGNALKSQILSQYGPKIKVDMVPVGMVYVDFGTEFESSGINQTRHRIFLIIRANIKVIVPFTSSTKEVVTQIPVCETIVVGKVPHNYVNIPREGLINVLPNSDE